MHFKNVVSGAAVLLAYASGVSALGTATVVNNCGFPVYYAPFAGSSNPSMQQLQGNWSQPYNQYNVGFSIKLAPEDSLSGPISQFEYTCAKRKISYDLSNINGYPFSSAGMEVVPSMQNDTSNPTCLPVICPAGQSVCSAAYNHADDLRTMVCHEDSDLVMTLCPDGSSTGSQASNSTDKRSLSNAGVGIFSRVHARHFPAQA